MSYFVLSIGIRTHGAYEGDHRSTLNHQRDNAATPEDRSHSL